MLLQSHAGEIHVLPALPDAWKTGSVKGLKARGNYEVDIEWENGNLVEVNVTSFSGIPAQIRYNDKLIDVAAARGGSFTFRP
jgi:alpha-L-fucosidase 2